MRRLLLICTLAMTACSGGGGKRFGTPVTDDGGGGGGGFPDLAVAPDGSVPGPPDLAMPPPPPDLATRPPDLAVVCTGGRYAGTVMASITVQGFPYAVTGPVELQVAAGGPQLAVMGRMNGTGQFNGTASADVVGTLDCGTLQFDGQLQNGMASALGFMLPFTGTITATYRVSPPAFINGRLTTNGLMGSGTWTADFAP